MRRTFVIWYADHEICGHCLSASNRRIARYRCVLCACPGTQSSALAKWALHREVNSSDWIQNYSERWMSIYRAHQSSSCDHYYQVLAIWSIPCQDNTDALCRGRLSLHRGLQSRVSKYRMTYRNASSTASVRDGKVNNRYLNLCSRVTGVLTRLLLSVRRDIIRNSIEVGNIILFYCVKT
jgi:hypothetical protein